MVPSTAGPGPGGAASGDLRRHNLSTILRIVHLSGPTSRADLTRATGLNRSTIGDLVTVLVGRGLVIEGPGAEGGVVGRPSPVVRPDPGVLAVAVNPDIDAVVVGLVGLGGRVRMRERVPTDGTPSVEESMTIVEDVLARHAPSSDDRILAFGIVVPGLVRQSDHVVVDAPHLGWRDADVASAYRKRFALPTSVDNDANAGLLAEAAFGSARGDDVVYLNGSTSGIGAAVISGGRLLRGSQGFAGELGHTVVSPDGRPCRCGRTGCLETEVNLENLEAAAGARRLDPESLGQVLASPRSAAVDTEVDRQVSILARGIADAVSAFNPGIVILGGFLGALFDVGGEKLVTAVKDAAFGRLIEDTAIVRATLRENRLMIGGGEVAFATLMDNPAGWTEPTG